jgi:hypothetical protein
MLHLLTPVQAAALIVAFGLIVQGSAVGRVRKAIKPGSANAVLSWWRERGAYWRRSVALGIADAPAPMRRRDSSRVQRL